MTRATWNRIAILSDAAIVASDTFDHEREDRLDACIDRLLKRAGINLDIPEWDLIEISYYDATIQVYDDKGELIKTFNVLEIRPQAA